MFAIIPPFIFKGQWNQRIGQQDHSFLNVYNGVICSPIFMWLTDLVVRYCGRISSHFNRNGSIKLLRRPKTQQYRFWPGKEDEQAKLHQKS